MSVDGLRERYRVLHGRLREEAAYRLALLDCAAEVLREVSERVARAERFYMLALRDEEQRWAELVAAAAAANEGPPLRPVWSGNTWRTLASLAAAKAKEAEWFELVASCAVAAARARDELRPDREILFNNNEGDQADDDTGNDEA